MAETLSNGTVIPQGSDLIHSSGVQAMRNLGGSVDAQLGNRALTDHTHSWSQITGKPTNYSPSTHSHPISQVTGLQAALDALAAFTQDTGWRDVSTDLRGGATGTAHVRRIGMQMFFRVRDLVPGTAHTVYWPPAGMRAPRSPLGYPPQSSSNGFPFYLDANGIICRDRTVPHLQAGRWWEVTYPLPAGTAPIASPPGVEVS